MPPVNKPTISQRLLGGLLAIQFLAILIANLQGFLSLFPQPAASVAVAYTEITGQPQWWGMFQAGEMRHSVAWDMKIELVDGRVERVQGIARLPQDADRFNAPAKWSRRFVYESSILGLDILLPAGEISEGQRATFVEEIRGNNHVYEAFFRSIYERERAKHADWPAEPMQMELVILRAAIRDPQTGEADAVESRWVARWRPSECTADTLAIEAYDLDAPDPPYRRFAKP